MQPFHFQSILLFLALCLITSKLTAQTEKMYAEVLVNERSEKDKELRMRKTSPLQKEDRKHFDHLYYFDVDESWNLTAKFKKLDGKDTVDFATSAGKVKRFVRYAKLTFDKDGAHHSFFAYKRVYPAGFTPTHAPYLFIPFTDMTTGSECYGGGRYMDTEVPEEGVTELVLDFNRCYNPYCAYGDGFACPIPPKDNFLNLRVDAGEKAYGDH